MSLSSGRPRAAVAFAALVAVPLLAGGATGCSTDTHPFLSTATAPKSVDVRYVQSGETAWSMDIPEGHELTLNFDRPGEGMFRSIPNLPATKMEWELKRVATGTDDRGRPVDNEQSDSGTVDLNGLAVQMDVRLRTPGGAG